MISDPTRPKCASRYRYLAHFLPGRLNIRGTIVVSSTKTLRHCRRYHHEAIAAASAKRKRSSNLRFNLLPGILCPLARTGFFFNRDRAGEPPATIAIGTLSAGVWYDLRHRWFRQGFRPLHSSGREYQLFGSPPALTDSHENGSREFMAGKPASTVRWSEAPPKWSFREVTVYSAQANSSGDRGRSY
jgi:hypothetical protein